MQRESWLCNNNTNNRLNVHIIQLGLNLLDEVMRMKERDQEREEIKGERKKGGADKD